MKHICDNCGAKYTDETLEEVIGDFRARVSAGNIVPSGECRECGSLVYPQDGAVRLRRPQVEELASLCGYLLETEYDSMVNYLEHEPAAEEFMSDSDLEQLQGSDEDVSKLVDRLAWKPENTHVFALAYRLHHAISEEDRA